MKAAVSNLTKSALCEHILESYLLNISCHKHILFCFVLYVQGELDTSLAGVRSCCEELKHSVELQQQYERLVLSLQELLVLGPERLAQKPDAELRDRAHLQQQLSSHTVGHTRKFCSKIFGVYIF